MPTPTFQHQVADFVQRNDLEISIQDRTLDFVSEVGELAKEILKSTDYGRQDFRPIEAWQDELGDVFFSLICLANTTDVNLQDALHAALEKYQMRLENQGEVGSSDS